MFSRILGSSILLVPWLSSAASSYGAAQLLTHGTAAIALAAALSPPLAIGATFALGRTLRGSQTRAQARALRREGEQLMADPAFIESLNQMRRGEGRPVRTREEQENQ